MQRSEPVLGRKSENPTTARTRRVVVVVFVGLALTLALSACTPAGDGPGGGASDPSATGEPAFRNWVETAEYVGRETCGTCHQAQYDTFVRSQMGRSWKHATRALSDADWDNTPVLRDEYADLYFQPFARGEDLFVREFRLSGTDTTHLRVEQIDFIAGSGHHTNSHIYERGGYLYQIPVTWYTQDRKWGLAPKFQGGNNYRFSRVITDECMACHNAPPSFVEGSENRFTNVPSGIGCENCHGPGSIHVEEKRAGIMVNTAVEMDNSIVNPAKLSPERQLDLCSRCHMQGVAVFEDGESPLDWRPGQVLAAHENVYWPRQPDSVSTFIMASHPDRLAMSACFQASWAEGDAGETQASSSMEPMTCLTCHDPHVPIEEMPKRHYDTVCQSCHAGPTAVTTPCTEPSVVSGANTATCSSCHMPPSGTSDIPYVKVTDHFIRVQEPRARQGQVLSDEESARQQAFIRLASLIQDEPSHRNVADGFLTYYEQFTDRPGMLDSAAVRLEKARALHPEEDLTASWIRLWHLQEDYAAIVQYTASTGFRQPEDAWTAYRIGEAYQHTGRMDEAVAWFERAVSRGRDHLRFSDKLAVAWTQVGRAAEAVALYDRLLSAQNRFETGFNNRGFAYLVLGDFAAAEADFRRAIAIDPDLEEALANLASLLYNTGRVSESRPYVQRLLRINPSNPDYIGFWDAVK